ncbi:TPA: DNA circularization protein [Kluyvera cryocrescens]
MANNNWESLREASFRNVPFYLVDNEGVSGRRAIPRAYPKKEIGWTEDNGAILGQQQINAKLVGDDFQSALERLLNALNQPGPGELVHPWYGRQKVQIGRVTHRLTTEEGDIAYISFEVFEAGERLYPVSTENTSLTTLSAADKVKAALENGDYFAALDGLGDMVDTWLGDMESLVANLPTIPTAVTDWIDRASRFKDLASVIIAKPGELVRQVLNLTSTVNDIVSESPWALRVYDQLRNQWANDRAEKAATRTRDSDLVVTPSSPEAAVFGVATSVPASTIAITDEMQTNIDDFRQLVTLAALVAQAEAIATTEFETSADALDAGDRLAGWLSDAAVGAVEGGRRELWRTLRDLRFAVVNDVRVRGAQLPDLRQITPLETSTVALIAWRETGDTENRDAIVLRNRMRDPSFILPSTTIEVIE